MGFVQGEGRTQGTLSGLGFERADAAETVSILNNAVRFRTSHHANAREHSAGIKRVAPCLFQDGRLIFSELFIDLHHLRDGRLFAWAPKHVAQSAQHTTNRRAVNLGVCAPQVA